MTEITTAMNNHFVIEDLISWLKANRRHTAVVAAEITVLYTTFIFFCSPPTINWLRENWQLVAQLLATVPAGLLMAAIVIPEFRDAIRAWYQTHRTSILVLGIGGPTVAASTVTFFHPSTQEFIHNYSGYLTALAVLSSFGVIAIPFVKPEWAKDSTTSVSSSGISTTGPKFRWFRRMRSVGKPQQQTADKRRIFYWLHRIRTKRRN